MLQALPCQLSVYAISRLLPHHSWFATPSQQTRLLYWVLPYFSSHFDPSPPLPYPQMFSQSLSFNDAREERKRPLKTTLHTHINTKKAKLPHILLLAKLIDALHLRAKVAAAISWDQLHICKQASKQGGGTERYLIFWSLLLTTQIGFHLLICNVSLFVCFFFFPWRLRQEDFLVNGWDGFSGLSGCQAAFMKLHSFVGHSLIGLEEKRGKKRRFFWRLFCFFFCHITFWAWAKVYIYEY